MTIELKDGDIYRWHYNDERRAEILKWRSDPYWCASRIAVVKDGHLFDTYWYDGSSSSLSWSAEEAENELIIKFVANFSDLEKAAEHMSESYDDADIVDINHANSSRGNFYIRRGAQRSRAKMLETAQQKIDAAQREIQSAQWQIERYTKIIGLIETGADLAEVYL